MSPQPKLTLRALRVRAVQAPMKRPLQTSGGTVRVAPLALIDLVTEEGVTGRSYLFCYTPLALKPVVQLLHEPVGVLKGDAVAPLELDAKLQRTFRLLGASGFTGMAMAGIDMAAWDALARARACRWCACSAASRRPRAGLQQLRPGHHRRGARRRRGGRAGARRASAAIKVRLGYPDARDRRRGRARGAPSGRRLACS